MKFSLTVSPTVTYRLHRGDLYTLYRFITGQSNEGFGQLIVRLQVGVKWHEIQIASFVVEYYPFTRAIRGYKK